jgi:hypothetical protein
MPIGGTRLIRIGIAAIFLVLAGAAILVSAARALDMQGDERLAQLDTGPDTQQHWARLSGQMVAGKTPLDAAALAALRHEAVRNPFSAMPYFLTGASRKLTGDAKGGAHLVGLAVSRDPRFLPPRYWNIYSAAERNQIEAATDATLRVVVLDRDSIQTTTAMLVRLTASRRSWPAIRAALPQGATWREIYYNKLVDAGFEPSIVFDVIDVARQASGKPPEVREQNALLGKMAQSADYDRAYTAWLGWLPEEALGKVAYLYDGRFSGAPGAAPFNWTFAAGGDGTGTIDHDRGLRFDYSGAVSMDIATETMLVPPGHYRLAVSAALDEALSPDTIVPLAWQIVCLPARKPIADLRLPNSAASAGVAAEFDVPADCPAQQLSLHGMPSEVPVRVGGYVRSVAIEKVK